MLLSDFLLFEEKYVKKKKYGIFDNYSYDDKFLGYTIFDDSRMIFRGCENCNEYYFRGVKYYQENNKIYKEGKFIIESFGNFWVHNEVHDVVETTINYNINGIVKPKKNYQILYFRGIHLINQITFPFSGNYYLAETKENLCLWSWEKRRYFNYNRFEIHLNHELISFNPRKQFTFYLLLFKTAKVAGPIRVIMIEYFWYNYFHEKIGPAFSEMI